MNLRHSLLLVTVAFGAGLLFTLWKQDKLQLISPSSQETPAPTDTTADIQSDTFTLRALQAAIESNEGNILLAPHALAENLRTLQQMSQGATKAELEALHLGTERQSTAETAGEVALLFPDSSLQFSAKAPLDNAIPVPLRSKEGEPILILNSLLNDTTGEASTHFITGEHLAADTRLISFCSLSLRPTWKHPVLSAKEANTDFFNADGSMPRIRTLQSTGQFRHAQAEDGSWQAIAIPLQLSSQPAMDECLLLIMPKENSARSFAKNMTAKQLTSIRKAVAQAELTRTCVEFPRISFAPPTQDIQALLQALGLTSLLSPQADLSLLASDKPLFLNAALQKCRIPLVENCADTPQDVPELSFDKPFIWIIGSLRSPAPPYAIGIVENL